MNEIFDITVYYRDGSTKLHPNVSNPDRILELENLPFTDPNVVDVESKSVAGH